jgi:hypothetical protein
MIQDNNFVNILMGPKLGDLMHALTVPAYYYKFLGIKTNFYINEIYDKFSTSLERTYEELLPILTKQPYINSFEIYEPKIHSVVHEDLNAFRYNGLLYTRSFWAVFLHTAFHNNPIIPKNFVALEMPKNDTFGDCLLIHRKDGRFEWTDTIEKNYKTVLDQFDKKIFIDFESSNYKKFKFKHECELFVEPDLGKFLEYVNGCKVFLTNASGPLCMATSMNSPRIGELGHFTSYHYKHDHIFFDNCEFFDLNGVLTPNTKYLK